MVGKSWLILSLSPLVELKLQRNKIEIRKIFTMPVSQNPDSRIAVIGAFGGGLVALVDLLLRSTDAMQRRDVVIFAAEARPVQWPAELRLVSLESDELATQEGCLCCSWRSELPAKLGQLFLDVLRRKQSVVKAVVVVSSSGNVDILQQTLRHAPFLAQRFRLAYGLLLTDA